LILHNYFRGVRGQIDLPFSCSEGAQDAATRSTICLRLTKGNPMKGETGTIEGLVDTAELSSYCLLSFKTRQEWSEMSK
jgi:hypothetical protein